MHENELDRIVAGMPTGVPGIDDVLGRALSNAGIVVVYQEPDLRVRWAQNVPSHWGEGGIVGLTDEEFLPTQATGRIAKLKRQVLDSGRAQRIEFETATDVARWYDMWLDVDFDGDGRAAGLISTIVDITDRKKHEQTLRTLLREVSHRSKNLLAIILSIATQTGRYSGSVDGFLDRFRGRVQSLASSQDIVTSSDWRGATLRELIEGQAGRYCENVYASIRQEGVDPYLTPNAALHIGLALHELVVNSVAHGALSRPDGHVRLTAHIDEDGHEGSRRMVLEWSERTQGNSESRQKRFGSMALERVVPLSLDGKASLTNDGDRLVYRLSVPEQNFAWPVRPAGSE